MTSARDIPGTVFKNGSAVLLARVVDADGLPLVPDAISSARYSIARLDEHDADVETPIAGHTDRNLDVSDLVRETLQVDPLWDHDDEGYNLRHELDVSDDPAFAIAGRSYRIRYELTPHVGQVILVRFRVKCM